MKRFGKPSNTTRALGDWLWNGKMVGYWSSTAQHSIVTARLVLVHLVLSRLALHRTPGAGVIFSTNKTSDTDISIQHTNFHGFNHKVSRELAAD